MNGGWDYRVAWVVGTAALTAFAIPLVNDATERYGPYDP